MHKLILNFRPSVVIVDPLNSFFSGNNELDAKAMSMRLIDFLKLNQITGFFTSLTSGGSNLESTDIFISSLIDTWILLRDIEISGERNRGIYILKSRGMSHSNQIREFLLTSQGIQLRDVYVGMEGVLTGSARLAQEVREKEALLRQQQEIEHKQLELEHKRRAMEAHIAALRAGYEAEEAELNKIVNFDKLRKENIVNDLRRMAKSRKADSTE